MMKNRIRGVIHSFLTILVWSLALGFSVPAFGADGNPRDVPLPADDARVIALLAERPFEERVWTIHRIGKEKRARLIPNLIERLDLDRYPKYEAELALDALFKLEAFVPDEVLLKLLNDFPDKAAIMLAFQPERHETGILTVFGRYAGSERETHRLRAVLAANLALKAGTPGFAKALVERRLRLGGNQVAVDLVIRRRAENESRMSPGGLVCGCGRGCGALQPEAKFPTIFWTELSDWPLAKPFVEGPGHVVVINLDCPINYEPSSAVSGFSKEFDDPPVFKKVAAGEVNRQESFFDCYLFELVAEKAGFRRKETVVWKGRRAFSRQVERARAGGEANFRRIVNRLVERGSLARAEADTFKPEFVVRIMNPDGLRIPQLPQTVPGDGK